MPSGNLRPCRPTGSEKSQAVVCRDHYLPPAAPFLGRQEMEERTGQRGFPLCNSPKRGVNRTRLSARLAAFLRTARYRLARRRYRSVRRFVPTLGDASQGATAGTPCRSYPKRGRDYPIAAHGVKRRPQIVCRAPDGVKSLATRAGFQRAKPFGCSCILLAGQKYAPGGKTQRSRQTPI